MSKFADIKGFTLVELIVVVTIISFLFFFSFPALKSIRLFSGSSNAAQDLAGLADELRERAISHQLDYQMHLDITASRIWITNSGMDDEQKNKAKDEAFVLSKDMSILSVLFLTQTGPETETMIRFFKQGHSDSALIHLTENGKYSTVRIEPFLLRATFSTGLAEFENCN